MIKTFVLIMVIAQGSSQGGNSTLSVDFNDEASCIKAMRIIASDVDSRQTSVISYGCYPLGDK